MNTERDTLNTIIQTATRRLEDLPSIEAGQFSCEQTMRAILKPAADTPVFRHIPTPISADDIYGPGEPGYTIIPSGVLGGASSQAQGAGQVSQQTAPAITLANRLVKAVYDGRDTGPCNLPHAVDLAVNEIEEAHRLLREHNAELDALSAQHEQRLLKAHLRADALQQWNDNQVAIIDALQKRLAENSEPAPICHEDPLGQETWQQRARRLERELQASRTDHVATQEHAVQKIAQLEASLAATHERALGYAKKVDEQRAAIQSMDYALQARLRDRNDAEARARSYCERLNAIRNTLENQS